MSNASEIYFIAMVLSSIVALIFFGLIAFIIGGILVSIYVIADMIVSCKKIKVRGS